jgi:hypothetical protein
MTRIYIEWIDAYSHDDWVDQDIAITMCSDVFPVKTTGYLLAETKYAVIICHSVNEKDKRVCGILHIPRKCIIRKMRL